MSHPGCEKCPTINEQDQRYRAGTGIIVPLFSAPSEPTHLRLLGISQDGSAFVTWKEPTISTGPINGYEIAVGVSGNETLEWVDINRFWTDFQLVNLVMNVNYTVHLIAYNLVGISDRRLRSKTVTIHFLNGE